MGKWVVGQWIVGVISFQKTFGLCGIKGHTVAKRKDVLDGRKVKIELEFRILNSQQKLAKRKACFSKIPIV